MVKAAEAHRQGLSAYLTKPLRPSQLHQCIATVMDVSAETPEGVLPARRRSAEALAANAVSIPLAAGRDNAMHEQ